MARGLLVFLAACSFTLGSPTRAPDGKVKCERSYTLPLLDATVAAASAAVVYSISRDCHGDQPDCMYQETGILIPGALAAVSAVYGALRVGECRDALAPPRHPPLPQVPPQ